MQDNSPYLTWFIYKVFIILIFYLKQIDQSKNFLHLSNII